MIWMGYKNLMYYDGMIPNLWMRENPGFGERLGEMDACLKGNRKWMPMFVRLF